MTSKSTNTRPLPAALAIAVLLIAALAYNVLHTEMSAQSGLEQEFGRRAALASKLTTAALGSTTAQVRAAFGGPSDTLDDAMREFQSYAPDSRAAVLDASGAPLVTWPIGSAQTALIASPTARRALRGGVSISDLTIRSRGRHDVTVAVPFDTPGGRRVAVETVSADIIESFASAYLASAPAVRGGQAYLIDGNARVLASSTRIPQGRPLADRPLAAALRDRRSGTYGDRYFVAAPLQGTDWNVVLSTSRPALLAPLAGSRRTAWLLFAAFVGALLALGAVGLAAMRKSSQLAGARERERASQRLAHERLHDALTGLPNGALFLERTQRALAAAGEEGSLAVLSVDIDRFKRINDSLGHAIGDELLIALAARLDATLRAEDTVSRFGSDEFLILCTNLEAPDDARCVARRVIGALERPFELGSRRVHVSACVGIALHRAGSSSDGPALVRDADAAMHGAKVQGPGSVRMFDSALHGEALLRLDTEVALRAAIGDEELCVHYQPIVALPDGRLRGVEALVRWQRPEVGLVGPLEFIGLAEECGLIGDLGRWVLCRAMTDVADWGHAGLIGPDFVLSVNISTHQLTEGGLPGLVEHLLESWALRPEQLWLEITETAVATEPEVALAEIRALSALGVRVAIDDFGVGHSSLEQLVQLLPVDILKLDRSFTGNLGDCRQRAVVAAVAPMAEALEMTAIAEGVETTDQADELGELGYPLAQGFHFGRPVDASSTRMRLIDAALAIG